MLVLANKASLKQLRLAPTPSLSVNWLMRKTLVATLHKSATCGSVVTRDRENPS